MSGDDTYAMGYNPHRKFIQKRGDLALVAASIVLVLVLVLWAFSG